MKSPRLVYADQLCQVYHGMITSSEQVKSVCPDPFDLCIADPPYGIDITNQQLGSGVKDREGEDWDRRIPEDEFMVMLDKSLFKRSCIWGANYYPRFVEPSASWLIWDKDQSYMGSEAELAWTDYGCPTRTFKLNRLCAFRRGRKSHITQKPEHLISWCILLAERHFTVNTIADMYSGSGTTAVVAKQLGIKCVSFEMSVSKCDSIAERLSRTPVERLVRPSKEKPKRGKRIKPIPTEGEVP